MKTLKSKMIGAITGLAMLSGCAGLGAVYMQSDDPATRAWGTLMHNEGSHEQRMEESTAGRSQVNVNVGGGNQQQSYEIIKCDHGINIVTFEYETLSRLKPGDIKPGKSIKFIGRNGYTPAENCYWEEGEDFNLCTICINK